VKEVSVDYYVFRNGPDVWRANTVTIVLTLEFSNGETEDITRTENRVDWDDKPGSNIQKSFDWDTGCAKGRVTYDILLSPINDTGFVTGATATFTTRNDVLCPEVAGFLALLLFGPGI